MSRPRVVLAGLGDTGLLTAGALRAGERRFGPLDLTGVATTPALVSGQELGVRLARPEDWRRDYLVELRRYRSLQGARVVHGAVVDADLDAGEVRVARAGGGTETLAYDVLVVATGVANGFWRDASVRSTAEAERDLRARHEQVAGAGRVAVVGGGAAAVSVAGNLALTWPDKQVDLYFPGERPLPQHHGRTWVGVRRRLEAAGVGLHPGHRAVLPESDEPSPGPVTFSTSQPPAEADLVLWAVGRVRPHTGWLPSRVLDDGGFVRTGLDLRVRDAAGDPVDGIFAIGDVAATDPLRSSARNFSHHLLARNLRAHLDGRPPKEMTLPGRRWGSVLGPQPDGLDVWTASGRRTHLPRWFQDRVIQPVAVRRVLYGGVRRG